MEHVITLGFVLSIFGLAAAAADVEQHLRARYAALDENADLCRGQQVDRTPEMRTAPNVAGKHTFEAINQRTHQQENRS